MIKLLFAGDVVIQELQGSLVDVELKKFLTEHTVVSANLEAPLHTTAEPLSKIGPNISQSPSVLATLKEAGFTMLSLANNHICDFGHEGLQNTLHAAREFDVLGAGTTFNDAYRLSIKTFGTTRFGFLGLAEWGFGASVDATAGGFAWINHPNVNNLISQSKMQVDVLIVQVHAGVEEIDIPLPEWRARYRELITLGADVIVGHHPHTIQGYEEYQGGKIFYSLGNFLFQKNNPSTSWTSGLLLSLTYEGASLQAHTLTPINASAVPVTLDTSKEAVDRLTRAQHMLENTTYQDTVDGVVLKLWQERYRHFFTSSLGGYYSFRGLVRSLKNFLLGKAINYRLLSHNLNIESHRYVAMRVAKLLGK